LILSGNIGFKISIDEAKKVDPKIKNGKAMIIPPIKP
jgi:hypothetical protein